MASESELTEVVQLGQDIISFKLYSAGITALWAYDYLLTVGDEVRYAWKTKGGLMFVLFLLIRYLPAPFLMWGIVASWSPSYTSEMCKKTAFGESLYIVLVTALAQVVLAQRTYAITMENKWVARILYTIAAAQFGLGAYIFIHATTVSPATMPAIPLDSYRLCLSGAGSASIIAYISVALAFDITVFVLIIVQIRLIKSTYSGVNVPGILDTVGRDAEIYFVVVSSSHFLVVVMYSVARPMLRALAPYGSSVLIPMMMTRIVISLKKAASSRQTRPDLEVPNNVSLCVFKCEPNGSVPPVPGP